MVPRHIFEEFIAFAHDSDLEDVLTLQTKLYRCAHIFLGMFEILKKILLEVVFWLTFYYYYLPHIGRIEHP